MTPAPRKWDWVDYFLAGAGLLAAVMLGGLLGAVMGMM